MNKSFFMFFVIFLLTNIIKGCFGCRVPGFLFLGLV